MRRRHSVEIAKFVLFGSAFVSTVLSSTVVLGSSVLSPCRANLPYYVWDHCKGSVTYSGKEHAVGEFRNGKLNGPGTYTAPTGVRYVGEFKDDMFNGQGSLRDANSTKYVGEFKDGEKSGQGTETLVEGSEYVGTFVAGKKSGQGILSFANGDKYVGEFKVGKLNGQGSYTFANGDKYVGVFKDGKQEGHSTLTFAKGSVYIGEFKEGKSNGQGTQTLANGDKYSGEFKDGLPYGQGTIIFRNGDQYVGAMRNGQRNGHGTLTFTNGEKYVGEFKDAKQDGQGTLFAANQTTSFSGVWAGGKFLESTSDQELISMEKNGGVYIVPIRLNDTITLNGIVDSGASDLSIPADIVFTLIRTKTITDEDFLGQQTYILADGSKVPSQQFRIRSLRVGNKVIANVTASISSVKGEILLGQSFLGKFKSWSVDNERHTLVLR